MNFAQLKQSILNNVNDPSGDLFSDEKIVLYINNALRDIYQVLLNRSFYLNRKTVTVSFVAGTQTVLLPTDFLKPIFVKDKESGFNIDIKTEREAIDARVPCVYFTRTVSGTPQVETRYIGWYEVPSSGFDVIVNYAPYITLFADIPQQSDFLLDIPENHHNVIVYKATILILGQDIHNIEFWQNQYNEAMQGLIESFTEDQQGQTVTDVMEDY